MVARSIFQEACKRKLSWDEDLPYDLRIQWCKWANSLSLLESCSVGRYLTGSVSGTDNQIHVFCDGSLKAYGAVAYLRSVNDGVISCNIIMSKVRQTPIGNSSLHTVPRIELNSAKVAVLLKIFIMREMFINCPVYFWSDSMTVLKYIKNETVRFHRFVENRVNFIRTNSSPFDWHFVPGKLNVADILSRGINVDAFCSSLVWRFGPQFLSEPKASWPIQSLEWSVDINDEEIKKTSKVAMATIKKDVPFNKLLDCSSWFKLLIRVSVFIAYCRFCKSGVLTPVFAVSSLRGAENVTWKYIQQSHFGDQISSLSSNCCLRRGDPLEKLSPMIDELGLVRVGGRLQRSCEPYSIRHPIILPGRSSVVKLLINHFHVSNGHMGKNHLLSSLTSKYWIINRGPVVNSILRGCVQCRRQNGKVSQIKMSSLPADRVTGHRPAFYASGVDFFGPFITTRGRGKSSEKRYGVVFTCLASRAVHFEVSYSLTTDSFINCLRRFISRRGQVKIVYSDNGTNLVGGSRELSRSVRELGVDAIERHLAPKEIEWHFNPPNASHFGGVWEREIRTCRKILDNIINNEKHFLTDELLSTFLCEAEQIMNARPLTAVSDDVSDLRALTPNHLLMVSPEPDASIGHFPPDGSYLRQSWRRVQHLAETFWLRWRREYLILLNERQKWKKDETPIKKDDLVLVKDILLPRNQWCLGRVIEEYPSEDGKVRSVKLRISRSSPKGSSPASTEIVRPVVKLIYLMSQ